MHRLVVALLLVVLLGIPGLTRPPQPSVGDLPRSILSSAPAITWTMADSGGTTWDISVTMTERGYSGTTLQDLHQYEAAFASNGCPTTGTIATGETVLTVVRDSDGSLRASLPFARTFITGPNGAGELPADQCPFITSRYDARFVSRAQAIHSWPDQVAHFPETVDRFLHLEGAQSPCPVPESASHTCLGIYPPQPLIAAPDSDSDGDGLSDEWEANGYRSHGTWVPLHRMGADPMHKDVFLEMDYDAGAALPRSALSEAWAAMDRVPVANPDGLPGINLHVDGGPRIGMTTSEPWGSLSRAEELDLPDHIDTAAPCAGPTDMATYHAVRDEHFSPARRSAFRYVLAVKHVTAGDNCTTGQADGIPGTGLIIGTWSGFADGSDGLMGATALAGTLLHELGHTMNLQHGGDDSLSFKPNYPSVMNYLYQLRGVTDSAGHAQLRFSDLIPGSATALDQDHLDEMVGIPDLTPGWLMFHRCGDQNEQIIPGAPADLDCNGTIVAGERSILMTPPDPLNPRTPPYGVLQPADDIPRLTFAVGDIGRTTLPRDTAVQRVGPPVAEPISWRDLYVAERSVLGDKSAPALQVDVRHKGNRRIVVAKATDDVGVSTIVVRWGRRKERTVLAPAGEPRPTLTGRVELPRRGPFTVTAYDFTGRVSPVVERG